ncbi:hypothetical protein [Neobacillus kokaensis]|uniref:Uncharacterized protein n=1 Tax=Neobacillus kokaensis TaxID=2759023 RepID=A0ABQ3N4Y8_9BACI|nr:hypothetical protein [Neobacillus kokaensis]GHH99156.1 hypothetical protein AM1BK_26990 [Neobacillus kokaensis]
MYFIPTKLNICNIKINSPDHKSAINFGANFLTNMNVAGKKSQGFGQQSADDVLTIIPISITFDDDIIDIPSIKIKGNDYHV